jgi:hypothetical protein
MEYITQEMLKGYSSCLCALNIIVIHLTYSTGKFSEETMKH